MGGNRLILYAVYNCTMYNFQVDRDVQSEPMTERVDDFKLNSVIAGIFQILNQIINIKFLGQCRQLNFYYYITIII